MKKILITLLLLSLTTFGWCGVDFNGDADYIAVNDDTSLNPTTDLAISLWVYPNSVSGVKHLMIKWGGSGTQNQYHLWIDTGNKFALAIRQSNGTDILGVSTTGLTLNTWQHIFVQANSTSGNIEFYVAGIAKGTTAYDGTFNVPGSPEKLGIGVKLVGGTPTDPAYYDGIMSEIALWNIALTTTEISLLAKSKVKGIPLQIQPSNLKLYLPLDNFSGGTALNTTADGYKDRSGNGNHGQGVDANGNSTNIAESILSYP